MKPASTPRAVRITTALLLIDLINTWRLSDGRKLLNSTLSMLPQLARLKGACGQGARAGHLHQRQLRPVAIGFQAGGGARA